MSCLGAESVSGNLSDAAGRAVATDAEYAVGELFGLKFKCVDVSMQFRILFFKLGDSFFEEWQMAQHCFVYYLVSHDGCVCRMNI